MMQWLKKQFGMRNYFIRDKYYTKMKRITHSAKFSAVKYLASNVNGLDAPVMLH